MGEETRFNVDKDPIALHSITSPSFPILHEASWTRGVKQHVRKTIGGNCLAPQTSISDADVELSTAMQIVDIDVESSTVVKSTRFNLQLDIMMAGEELGTLWEDQSIMIPEEAVLDLLQLEA